MSDAGSPILGIPARSLESWPDPSAQDTNGLYLTDARPWPSPAAAEWGCRDKGSYHPSHLVIRECFISDPVASSALGIGGRSLPVLSISGIQGRAWR